MESSPVVLVAVVALAAAVVLFAAVVLVHRSNRRHRLAAEAEIARARAEADELRARVEALAVQVSRTVRHDSEEFVITSLSDPGHDFDESPSEPAAAAEQRIDGKLFVDLLARETVVKAAAFGHGVRRALAPENRNRIRFEMKREVKRSRKSRKDEFKRVRAEMRARDRRAAFIDSPRIPGQPNTQAGTG